MEARALNGYNIKWLDLRCTLNGYIYIPLIIVESYFWKWSVWRAGAPAFRRDPKNAAGQARERRECPEIKSHLIKNGKTETRSNPGVKPYGGFNALRRGAL